MRTVEQKIARLQSEINVLEKQLLLKKEELKVLQNNTTDQPASKIINNNSSPEEKIKLFRSLFRGREDLYALRFESKKTGKSGYQPACANEWRQGICPKPKTKCSACENRNLLPLTDEVIKHHLMGEIPSPYSGGYAKPCVAGLYPMLTNETCCFLAVDFDKEQWQQDALAFLETCIEEKVPAYIERSRSGNGAHIWIFFNNPVFARQARELGSALMTKTLDRRPEVGLDSFDRFFPNQDTMPHGGFGNLIALPLQKRARDQNHSVFMDSSFQPVTDQWAFLASVKKVDAAFIHEYIQKASLNREVLPVSITENENYSDEFDKEPWSKKKLYPIIESHLPKEITITLSNQIFIPSTGLPPIFRNRILRLASFSNPEFYKNQAMRLPTWNKPRILYCYEQFPQHIALPIGCLDELKELFAHYKIKCKIDDKRNKGKSIDADFSGTLYLEQQLAAAALLKHETGILSATTAFGKTIVALSLIAERKVNTLILVHRKQLMEQWVERLVQFFGIENKDIGQFGGGRKKRTGIIDVAVIQSVCYKGEVKEWIKEYGQVIVDECHHISAYSFEQTIRQSDAFYKAGLSATLTRKDGQQPIVIMNLGKVRYSVNAKKQATERSFDHQIIIRPTSFFINDLNSGTLQINDLFHKLWQDAARNQLIVKDVLYAYQQGRQILVLSERTEHLEIFKEMLNTEIEHLFVLRGGLGKKQLKKIMQSLQEIPENNGRVILATGRYLGEGFDLPMLDTLFMCFPVSWKGTLTQYAGRLHREYHNKTEVIIYDYADERVPVLSRMFSKRLKGYVALGYKISD